MSLISNTGRLSSVVNLLSTLFSIFMVIYGKVQKCPRLDLTLQVLDCGRDLTEAVIPSKLSLIDVAVIMAAQKDRFADKVILSVLGAQ